MTIEQRIIAELDRLSKGDPVLHGKVLKLHNAVETIIHQLKAHLGEISTQMKEYDKHDASHSERVLENIEKLLREGGINKLSLLESMTLRLCCYFHDCGMILPECYLPLLEDIERDPRAELPEDLLPWLKENKKTYDVVRDQFYCPDSGDSYEEFLTDELDRYQKYRLGLPEEISGDNHFRRTRHDYLRRTHGERAKRYAGNLICFLDGIPYGGRSDLAEAVGLICASHCQEITEVRKLETGLEIIDSCPDMVCNVRYLAMLLRLGDVIHFSSDRASRTVYAERAAMDADSEIHWKTKFEELEYAIRPREKGVSISYSGCFEDPKAYYFLQSHLDRVDEELQNYAAFVSDMHDEPDADRYALGLPTKVLRDAIRANRFKPDQDLKFRLEHRKIIKLLMGMRLYRDEFMCLRELYQNALDACRCMRAENEQKGLRGELRIEFGLASDRDGDYLYCKDEGTGMTEEIVKNYLLRIGNSYYQSDEFRRSNAQWGDTVAPVSEFGIGLLSCYMIASRIEVITRHHTLPGKPPIWICMEDSDDYGYYRTPGRTQEKQVGIHGTYVKLYLKKEYQDKATGFIPEEPRDAVFLLDRYDPKEDTNVKAETKDFLERFENSLYHRIQQFVHIPESGIPVWVRGDEKMEQLFPADVIYDLTDKLPSLEEQGFPAGKLFWDEYDDPELFGTQYKRRSSVSADYIVRWLRSFDYYLCTVENRQIGLAAKALIHLPNNADINYGSDLFDGMDTSVSRQEDWVFIDGIPVVNNTRKDQLASDGIRYHFNGKIRPRLTVDRGEIIDVPQTVTEERAAIDRKLSDEIVAQIREHFKQKPYALTETAKAYVFKYLLHKFSYSVAFAVLRELSRDMLRDYRYYKVSLFEWFHEPVVVLDTDFLSETGKFRTNTLAVAALKNCTVVQFAEGKLQLQTKIPDVVKAEEPWSIYECAIKADNWPEQFAQYDVVRNYTGLVPSHTFALLDHPSSESDQRVLSAYGICTVGSTPSGWLDPVRMEGVNWHDFVSALQEKSGESQLHRTHDWLAFIEDGSKRYICYAYINPRPLTEADEIFLRQYCADIPKYREGVEKGWSILFYNYKDGYVVAPGIVDRMEMLKLLPREVLEHDDGLEYYFTDGTRAF